MIYLPITSRLETTKTIRCLGIFKSFMFRSEAEITFGKNPKFSQKLLENLYFYVILPETTMDSYVLFVGYNNFQKRSKVFF